MAPIYGTTMVQHLGPDHNQFKIVLTIYGKRIIVDQGVVVYEIYARAIYALVA